MGIRIVVRTIANVSFVGNICENDIFNEEGILLRPNPRLNMRIFVPKDEIAELIVDGKIMNYKEYILL